MSRRPSAAARSIDGCSVSILGYYFHIDEPGGGLALICLMLGAIGIHSRRHAAPHVAR
jgi:hypothetical protein